jgi:hypothetical protein
MLAVMENAIATFHKCLPGVTRRQRRLLKEVEEWFASTEVGWPFSFQNICAALDLNADYLRLGLSRWKAHQLAQQRPSTLSISSSFRRVNGRRQRQLRGLELQNPIINRPNGGEKMPAKVVEGKVVDSYRFAGPAAKVMQNAIPKEPQYDFIPWTPLRKPLPQCRFSLLTTAGIALKTDQPFDAEREKREPLWGDQSFRRIPSWATEKDIEVYHLHAHLL